MKRKVIIFTLFQCNLSNAFYVNYWTVMTLELQVITKKLVFTELFFSGTISKPFTTQFSDLQLTNVPMNMQILKLLRSLQLLSVQSLGKTDSLPPLLWSYTSINVASILSFPFYLLIDLILFWAEIQIVHFPASLLLNAANNMDGEVV